MSSLILPNSTNGLLGNLISKITVRNKSEHNNRRLVVFLAVFVFAVSIASTFAGMGKSNVGNQYLSTNLTAPTSGWKSYLINESTIRQSETFKGQVTDLRAGLPSSPKRGGNMAIAEINIPGMPKKMAAKRK